MAEREDTGRKRKCLVVLTFTIAFGVYGVVVASERRANTGGGFNELTPPHTLSLIQPETEQVGWKRIWDQARNHTASGELAAAANSYAELLFAKPGIEDARWEYCKVAMELGRYNVAAQLVAGLLEERPERKEYLLAFAEISSKRGDYTGALEAYGKVYEAGPVGRNSDLALRGMLQCMKALGKKSAAFPLLEQYHQRFPGDRQVLRQLAVDARDGGLETKAREYFRILLQDPELEARFIFQAAELFDTPQFRKTAVLIWQRYLRLNPDYIPFQIKLFHYFLTVGRYQDALVQLTGFVDKIPDNSAYLSHGGRICLENMQRPDLALGWYERLLQEHPNNGEAQRKIDEIQLQLARDFVVIAENDGAALLWDDLATVGAHRLTVFKKMAGLFKADGKRQGELATLRIIDENEPGNTAVIMRLAQLLFDQGKFSLALEHLDKVNRADRNATYYQLRLESELAVGKERAALESLKALLAYQHTGKPSVLMQGMALACSVGALDDAEFFFQQGVKQKISNSSGHLPLRFFTQYLQLLSDCWLFGEYSRVDKLVQSYYADSAKERMKLFLASTETLWQQGKKRLAEQQLRTRLNDSAYRISVVLALFDLAIKDRDLGKAEIWLDALRKTTHNKGGEDGLLSRQELKTQAMLAEARIDKLRQKYSESGALFSSLLNRPEKKQADDGQITAEVQATQQDTLKELFWLKLLEHDINGALAVARQLGTAEIFVPELYLLSAEKESSQRGDGKGPSRTGGLFRGHQLMVSRALAVSRLKADLDGAKTQLRLTQLAQLGVINKLLEVSPADSLTLVQAARLQLDRGNFRLAEDYLQQLSRQFPKEEHFMKLRVSVALKRARYTEGLRLLQDWYDVPDYASLQEKLEKAGDVDMHVQLARLLWGAHRQKEALAVYKRLLTPSVDNLLQTEFGKRQISSEYLQSDSSVWEMLLQFVRAEPENTANLMEPAFLLDNLGADVGRVVAEHYALYSWQKMINREYLARRAVYEKNYYYAEQSYKTMLSEDNAAEVMPDLADIYSRIGKYRKQAQLYETMQSDTAVSAELVESLDTPQYKLSPQLSLDSSLLRMNGRHGFVDIQKASLGSSFYITPDLHKEFHFSLAANGYEEVTGSQSLTSTLFFGEGKMDFGTAYDFSIGAGVEKFDGDSDPRPLYRLGLSGQLDDYVDAFVQFGNEYVFDTVAAVREDISFTEIRTGLNCETPYGVSFGGDLHHRAYSDGNSQNMLHGYSTYTVFDNSNELAFKYDYRYLANDQRNDAVYNEDNELATDRPLYWSPATYSRHQFALNFRQNFTASEHAPARGTSYYSVEGGIGVENDDGLTYSGIFDIFLEINPHFLLKGNLTYSTGVEYTERGMSLSLHYRW